MSLQRVHRVNRPLEVGETFLVPFVGNTPVLWPPHSDIHDGQPYRHYHGDSRFNERSGGSRIVGGRVEWRPATVVSEEFKLRTPVEFVGHAIARMGRSCNALRNGKCPHAGFNVLQARPSPFGPDQGLLVCPMHGMRFNPATGKGIPYRKVKPSLDEHEQWLQGSR